MLSLPFNGHFPSWTWLSRDQTVSILDFIGAKDDGGGGDNWSCNINKPTPICFTGWIPFLLPNQQCQSTEVEMHLDY